MQDPMTGNHDSTNARIPWYFWLVAGVGLLFFAQPFQASGRAFLNPEVVAHVSELHREFLLSSPRWWRLTLVLATAAGTVGSLLLLLRSRRAPLLYVFALLFATVNFAYEYLVMDVIAVFGLDSLFEPLVVLSVLGGLLWFGRFASQRGYLR